MINNWTASRPLTDRAYRRVCKKPGFQNYVNERAGRTAFSLVQLVMEARGIGQSDAIEFVREDLKIR